MDIYCEYNQGDIELCVWSNKFSARSDRALILHFETVSECQWNYRLLA